MDPTANSFMFLELIRKILHSHDLRKMLLLDINASSGLWTDCQQFHVFGADKKDTAHDLRKMLLLGINASSALWTYCQQFHVFGADKKDTTHDLRKNAVAWYKRAGV